MTKITIDRSTVEQALEALEALQGGCTDHDDGTVEAITVWCPEIIESLRAALAEPMQEPATLPGPGLVMCPACCAQFDPALNSVQPVQEPDSPERRCGGPGCDMMCCQPVQEPVAYLDEEINCAYTPEELDGGTADGLVPLYTAPPQRKPLTEEEIETAYRKIWSDLPSDFDHTSSGWIEQGIRYAEQAHKIGVQP